MHNNFYFLRQLTPALERMLVGSRLVDCFAQEKNEIVFHFMTGNQSRFVKAAFHSDISCLSFPESFARARKNSVDLFPSLPGHDVSAIRQFENERSFLIQFTEELSLMFKLHGNRSNIILFQSGSAVDLFRKRMKADLNLSPDDMDRTIDWSKDAFMANLGELKKLYFTFGKVPWVYLHSLGFEAMLPEEKWSLLQTVKSQLENGRIYLTRNEALPVLSILPVGMVQREYLDPIQAVNDFYSEFSRENAFHGDKTKAIGVVSGRLSAVGAAVSRLKERLHTLQHEHHYRYWGDLIMANLGALETGQSKVRLRDFSDAEKYIEIKMNSTLTPQRNAEKFYQKSKKQGVEINHLNRALAEKEDELNELARIKKQIEQADNLRSLRLITEGLTAEEKSSPDGPSLPYHSYVYKGYTIMIGKNARQNDELTLKVAHKDDLWLHAKDVSGSHVVVRRRPGQSFPRDVIERAAQIAAFNSKRKTESLCPVLYTFKKYVRKRKGDPPGAVIVERETVIMVVPAMPA